MRALRNGFQAFYKTVVRDLPPRPRFEAERATPPWLWDYVEPASSRPPLEYRWHCPDPNYDWHYAVDDQGFTASSDEAFIRLAIHWGVHHTNWNNIKEDHDAWQQWTKKLIDQ